MNSNDKIARKKKQTKESIMFIGIDDGYNATKDSKRNTFDAGVILGNRESSITGTKNVIEFKGVSYTYGCDPQSMIPDKSQNTDMLIHTLACIAEEAEKKDYPEKFNVVLGFGMPLKYYTDIKKRNAYIEYFSKKYRNCVFKHNEREWDITFIYSKCFPQAYAVYQVFKEIKKLKEAEYTIIDIGGNTVDCLGIANGKIRPESAFTYEKGINHLVDAIDAELRPDIRLSKETIKKCIREGKIGHGRAERIIQVCKEHTDKFVSELMDILRSKYDLMIPVIWVGGGYLFLNFRPEFTDPNTIYTQENLIFDEFANATAFEVLVTNYFKRDMTTNTTKK